ncbi:hypothetical protein GH714_011311 [Hevea brasiliensis]|uniref:C2 tensin-type domain-containing protein n=1 Tax=Hevea brasiliensis TaxID=3981 RepID=A0A6A6M9P4_HEVBR|nr:hypothetical protein GH714_011311 [Hevea brasiliensis]
MGGIVGQLKEHFPDSSFLVFNFREGKRQSQFADILSEYDMTIMDYPRQYEGCPLLKMEVIHHFLRSGESWLSLGQQNLLLMHCERGGWPVLAFMLAALLIYRKQYSVEQKTLDMIYRQAPRELLHLLSPLNPIPSQLRYLQYVSRRNVASEWPPLDRCLTLDCVILRFIPNFDGEGTECELVKIDINCHIQGDVVLECISLDDDMEHEQMMFRAVFNTAFIRSNILILNRDEIDTLWDAKVQFPKNFRAEVDATNSVAAVDFSGFEEKEGLPMEAFAKVREIFSSVDWLDSKADVARNVLQQISASNVVQENFDTDLVYGVQLSPQSPRSPYRLETSPKKHQERKKHMTLNSGMESSMFSTQKIEFLHSPKSSPHAHAIEEDKHKTFKLAFNLPVNLILRVNNHLSYR